ncbi:hypothetical protein [Sphingomonas sp. BK235]|uniref:hypothetical protein n=1 Tax=Sphingomonas sp. BK235 TaxID=2512131 RepID=UPI001052BF30|nr:hypothetical protein [Sphingomonas sp. BK235]TCP31348.1 hypothetical protein EV292_1103 [Sphingomonas sp. BK235]
MTASFAHRITEILQSIEHVRQPAVVGTSVPPRGESRSMRRLAFLWSEPNWLHWLILLGADRVDVVEGVVEDLSRGTLPNVPAEMGVGAAWRHNRGRFVTRLALAAGTIVVGAAIASNVWREREAAKGQNFIRSRTAEGTTRSGAARMTRSNPPSP